MNQSNAENIETINQDIINVQSKKFLHDKFQGKVSSYEDFTLALAKPGKDIESSLTPGLEGILSKAIKISMMAERGLEHCLKEPLSIMCAKGGDRRPGLELMHMGVGLFGEAGELLDAVKRIIIYGMNPGQVKKGETKNLHMNVVEELGDADFYVNGASAFVRKAADIAVELLRPSEDLEAENILSPEQYEGLLLSHRKIKDFRGNLVIGVWNETLNEFICAWNDNYPQFPITFDMVRNYNVEKLSKRYKDLCFSNEAATGRADETHVERAPADGQR